MPPTPGSIGHVGAMLALFSLLGASWASSALLAAFFLACWGFLRLLDRLGLENQGFCPPKTGPEPPPNPLKIDVPKNMCFFDDLGRNFLLCCFARVCCEVLKT